MSAARGVLAVVALFTAAPAFADWEYAAPGSLADGSGTGRVDYTVYVPHMRFPLRQTPSYLNSQVWGHGGLSGPGGSQCDTANYSYPWRDNFCETRSFATPMCPAGTGHQGQDIRAASCADQTHEAVAAEAGTISFIGSYSVHLVSDSGTLFKYLHMAPDSVTVEVGDVVPRGEVLGLVSNAFGTSSTTVHLHFEILENVAGIGLTPVPPYMSLVRAYDELLDLDAASCAAIDPAGGVLDDDDGCLLLLGPEATWRSEAGAGYGGARRWTYAWDNTSPGNWATWLLPVSEAGLYELEVYLAGEAGDSQAVPHRLLHDGRESWVTLDYSGASGWSSLGAFDLAGAGEEQLSIFDNTGEGLDSSRRLVVDALRLTRVDTGDDGGGDPGGDHDGGHELGPRPEHPPRDSGRCAAGVGVWPLVALVLFRARAARKSRDRSRR